LADDRTIAFRRRQWTPNECRYVQKLAVMERLKFRVALAVIVVLWLGLIGGIIFFVYSAFTERSLFSAVAALVSLLSIALIAYVFPRYWRACFTEQDSPWVDPLQGKLSVLEVSGYDGAEYYDAVGGREVRFPNGWLDYLRQGDEVLALRYPMDVELDRTGTISIILALDNGFSIDEEVELGLLDQTSLTYWLATLVAGALWWAAPTMALLARLRTSTSEVFWIPAAITTAIALLAVRRTLLDVSIRRQLDSLRQQHAPLRKESR
jgi:hypothetical protein